MLYVGFELQNLALVGTQTLLGVLGSDIGARESDPVALESSQGGRNKQSDTWTDGEGENSSKVNAYVIDLLRAVAQKQDLGEVVVLFRGFMANSRDPAEVGPVTHGETQRLRELETRKLGERIAPCGIIGLRPFLDRCPKWGRGRDRFRAISETS